jgi:UDPglucose--hexose-1-phosphate uridylyltransferase
MSEIRKDPLSHTWVIIATERSKRPSDFSSPSQEQKKKKKFCPLCEEAKEPPPSDDPWPGIIDEKTGKWLTRILPNKYPALSTSTPLEQGEVAHLYHYLSGIGGHELVLDSLKHESTLASMEKSEIEAMLLTYKQRFLYWKRDPRISYVLVFKNYKPEAGASLEHPHSQIIASPIIPPRIFEELREAKEHYKIYGECLLCSILSQERESPRKVFENESILCFTPFASRFPFETYFIPKIHQASLEEASEKIISDLAQAFAWYFPKVSKILNDPAFNYILHVAPLKTPGLLYYHWHIEVIFRLTRPAGYEFGSGIFINPVPPEKAAQYIKEGE